MAKLTNLFLITILIALAFAVRVYNIENVPAGVYPDEAVNGIDALQAERNGNYKWFYTDNNGREGLYINLIALSYKFFGVSFLGLKFPSIIFGVLTVLGIYLLSKELFRTSRAGLIASFLSAFSFWSINFSRIGFRAIMLPAILTFSFYFIFLGIRKKRNFYFALAGFIFGLGLHSYIAWRIAPAILIVLFISLWLTKKDFLKNYWQQGIIFIIFAIISMLPMLLTFYSHPEYLSSRTADVSVLSPAVNHGHFLKTFGRSLGLSLVKYNFWGDQNWRHNYPPYPILNPLVGITFLIGLFYLIIKFFNLLWLRFRYKLHDRKFYIYSFLLAWFVIMLAPEVMTAEGLPHALRAIGTLPVVYIIATIPFLWLLEKRNNFGYGFKISITLLISISLIFIAIFNITKYHYFWANNSKQYHSFEGNLIQISNYLQTISPRTKKIVVARNMQIIPIRLFNYDLTNTYWIHPDNLDALPKEFPPTSQNNLIFLLTEKQLWMAKKIIGFYPQLKLHAFIDDKAIGSENDKKIWVLHP